MERLTKQQWIDARTRWEGDPSLKFIRLANEMGVSRQAINKTALKQGWTKGGQPKKPPKKVGELLQQQPLVQPLKTEPNPLQVRLTRAQEIVNGFNLTPRIKLFVVEYSKDLNGTQAAIRSGYSVKTANEQSVRLLANVSVKHAFDAIMNDRIEQGIFDGDKIIQNWVTISQIDPNSLTQHRRVACRYCHGANHRYQYTPAEMEDAKVIHDDENWSRIAKKLDALDWDNKGGLGFNGTLDPHPDCPECWGEGVGSLFFADTRKLSPENLPLFAGVKQTKDGLEILTHSQADSLDKLARHFGLYRDKLAEAVAGSYTKEALEEKFADAMLRAQERQQEISDEREISTGG
ncbi:terminase small subunit [Glaciimonas sp. GNP009]